MKHILNFESNFCFPLPKKGIGPGEVLLDRSDAPIEGDELELQPDLPLRRPVQRILQKGKGLMPMLQPDHLPQPESPENLKLETELPLHPGGSPGEN